MSGREPTRSDKFEEQWILFEFRHYLLLVIYGWPFDLRKDITGSFGQRKCVTSRLSLSLLPSISTVCTNGGMLRFSDSFKSYHDRRFVIVGAALFMSPPLVGCGCPTQTLLLHFFFLFT